MLPAAYNTLPGQRIHWYRQNICNSKATLIRYFAEQLQEPFSAIAKYKEHAKFVGWLKQQQFSAGI